MPTRVPIVRPQRANQCEDLLGRSGDTVATGTPVVLFQNLKLPDVAGLARYLQPGRRPAREQDGHVTQGCERREASAQPIDAPHGE
jgi:hypothetical protein